MDPIEIAQTLRSDLENCMYDLADQDDRLADLHWNDSYVLGDLIGDRIFDACNCLKTDDDKVLAWEVSDHLMKIGHSALKEATLSFKKRQDLI